MNNKTDWAFRFFNNPDYLDMYHDMTSPQRTQLELNFCERVLGWENGQRILDAPCGAGRHSNLLGRYGFSVTGLDFSSFLLGLAEEDKKQANFPNEKPSYVRGLLQQLPFEENSFEHVVCLFSSFGYGETEDDNLHVMQEYSRVLKPGGKVLIDVMNRHFVVPRLNKVYDSIHKDLRVREERTLTNNGRRLHNIIKVRDKKGNQRQYLYNPWLYNGWELAYMANQAGMKVVRVYGDFWGNDYEEDGERAMLVAAKEESPSTQRD